MAETILALLYDPAAWAAFLTLVVMEIVLGIDNLIFIAIITNRLPVHQQPRARQIGIGLALIMRLALLGTIAIIIKLTAPIFTVLGKSFSWRDLILIAGGLFLVWKATTEIHHRVDADPGPGVFDRKTVSLGFAAAIGQIIMIDIVFSLDSIITAVGMTEHVPIMVAAVVITVIVMLVAATPLANFVNRNPTIVVLALGFLLMIGGALIAEGFGAKVPKGYIYAAMAFSALVEGINMLDRRARQRREQNPPG